MSNYFLYSKKAVKSTVLVLYFCVGQLNGAACDANWLYYRKHFSTIIQISQNKGSRDVLTCSTLRWRIKAPHTFYTFHAAFIQKFIALWAETDFCLT